LTKGNFRRGEGEVKGLEEQCIIGGKKDTEAKKNTETESLKVQGSICKQWCAGGFETATWGRYDMEESGNI